MKASKNTIIRIKPETRKKLDAFKAQWPRLSLTDAVDVAADALASLPAEQVARVVQGGKSIALAS